MTLSKGGHLIRRYILGGIYMSGLRKGGPPDCANSRRDKG